MGNEQQQPEEHCDHECVCVFFRKNSKIAFRDGTRCMANQPGCGTICNEDTRSCPSPASHTSASQQRIDALIKAQKFRMRQLFLDDAKCELCEKVTEEDGYDGQNEGCEKGLCIECAIDKSLREFAIALLQAGRK